MSNAAAPALEHRRVLVVEDEYFLADDIANALKQLGAEVVGPVATREDAIAELSGAIDAAVLDVNLRGETVFTIADALRARGVPFVFGTGYEAAALPDAYRDIPRWQKPFEASELVRALPQLIRTGA